MNLYDIIKQLQTIDYSFIYSRLEELRQTTLSLMEGSIKQNVDADKYNESINYLAKTFNKISIYITNRANIIISNHKNVENELNDQYLYFSLLKDYLYNFVLNYYRTLNDIISLKSVSYTENEKYSEIIDITKLQNEMKSNSELLYNISQKQLNVISSIKKECLEEKRRLEENKKEEEENNDIFDLGIIDYGDYDLKKDGKPKKGFIFPSNNKGDANDNKKKDFEETLEEFKISTETEINFQITNWTVNFASTSSAKKECGWDYQFGWQYPCIFPAFPLLQIRLGFRVEIYMKFIVGLEFVFNKENEKLKFDFKPLIDFNLGVKISAIAETGVYAGFGSICGGIEGSLLDARAGARIYYSFKYSCTDFYLYLALNSFKFKAYFRGEINLWFYKVKVTLIDVEFGLPEGSLYNCTFYIRYNWFEEFSQPDKKCLSSNLFALL